MKELTFGTITTESRRPTWSPFLADMEKATGISINTVYAVEHGEIVEAMHLGKVHVAHFGPAAAIRAVDHAKGEVFARTTFKTTGDGYYSVLIVHSASSLTSIEDVLARPGMLSLGNNSDPDSTSGVVVPGYYAWAKNHVDIGKHFIRVVTGTHEANMVAVAAEQVDVATGNTPDLERYEKRQPKIYARLRVIWRSPLILGDPMVWRTDLPESVQNRVRTFFVEYGRRWPGRREDDIQREIQVLERLNWWHFRPASNKQLIPARELELFREKMRIAVDDTLTPGEKAAQLFDIEKKIALLGE